MADEIEQIEAAIDGLEYPSESDAPFEIVRWVTKSDQTVLSAIREHVGMDRKISIKPVADFFAELEGSDDADRFGQLRQVLQSVVSDLGVFRIGDGEVKVQIFLIGKSLGGDWLGVSTVSTET